MKVRLRTLGILLLLSAAAADGFIYFGIYNIAANVQHTAPVYSLLEYSMRKSVKLRSDDIKVPDLDDEQRIRNGLRHYRMHCLQCHGAPGISPDGAGFGMTPEPANLVATARDWAPAELYWVIRNGIKMTGMPAWEYRMSEQEIWDVVAFIERMPRLSPQEYEAWSAQVAPRSHPQVQQDRQSVSSGDARAGKRALHQYLCATCHQIPGVVAAHRHVGPPLNGIAKRTFIAGVLPNTPENMVRWLQDPKQFAPLSAMPNLGVTENDARDMAAYLATLDDLY